MAVERVTLPEGFDFETYINNYEGCTRISRSIFIAKHCEQLSIEGYQLAINEIQKTSNTTKYTQLVELLDHTLPTQLNQEWINQTQKTNKTTLELLEGELKAAKSNLNKDEIRVCHLKLGDFFYKKGDHPTAIKNYIRTRDYSTTSQHILDMCFNVIKVYLDDCNFSHVIQTYISRAESTPNITPQALSKLKCYQAIVFLGGSDVNRYKLVAQTLTEIPFEFNSQLSDVLSPNDIAIYGGLCSLVTFDRQQISQKILNNSNFKNFLVLEPNLYELIECFHKSKYSRCFELLNKYQKAMRLDIYLASHIDSLVQLVRERAMVQYCIPYSNVNMKIMAIAFNITVDQLENELVLLVSKKEKISAKIDGHNKILYTKKEEKRNDAFERSIMTGSEYEKSSKALLLRLNLLKANLVITPK